MRTGNLTTPARASRSPRGELVLLRGLRFHRACAIGFGLERFGAPRSAAIATETEGVAHGINKHPHVRPMLASCERSPEGKRLRHGLFEVTDLEVQVQHRSLGTIDGWPDRRRIAHRLLKDEEGQSSRRV
jgi:hypothetical protein